MRGTWPDKWARSLVVLLTLDAIGRLLLLHRHDRRRAWAQLAALSFLLVLGAWIGPGSAWSLTPPIVSVTTPASGETLRGTAVLVEGTAVGEAEITAVAVSTDGGANWYNADIVSGAGTLSVSWVYTGPLPVDDNTSDHTISARATDSTGAVGSSTADPVLRIDNLPPAVASFYIAGDAEYVAATEVELQIDALDGSAPVQMQFSNDGRTWDPWRSLTTPVLWTLTPGDGRKDVWVRLRDGVGNLTTRGIRDSVVLSSAPPQVIGWLPADGTADVNPMVALTVLFSEVMDPATVASSAVRLWVDADGSGDLTPGGDSEVESVVKYDEASRSVTIRPTLGLAEDSLHFVSIQGSATSRSGLPMGADAVATFITGSASATNPGVASLTPPPGATSVLVTTQVAVLFDREMALAGLEGGISLVEAESGLPVAGRVEQDRPDARRVAFIPDRPLAVSTTYTFRVSGSLVDYAGVPLGQDLVSTFTTSDTGLNPHGTYTAGSDICGVCHAVHGAAVPAGFGSTILKESRETALCYTCHNGTGASSNVESVFSLMGSGHVVDDAFGPAGVGLTSQCSSCHDPHALEQTNPTLHRSTVNGVDVQGDDYTWCQACHDDFSSWFGPDYPYPSGGIDAAKPVRAADGYPEKGTFPGATVYNNTLVNPHNPTTSTNVVWPDSGLPSGDCRNCHGGHRTDSSYDGLTAQFRATPAPTPEAPDSVLTDRRTGEYAELCLTCHDSDGPAATDIKSFVTFEPDDPAATGGHRIVTAGGTLPAGAPLPCYDCHNPHGSAGNDGAHPNASLISDERWSGIDTSTTEGEVAFCMQCHLPWEYVTGSGEPEAGTVPAGQAETVEGLDRRDPINLLSLPSIVDAHGRANHETPTTTCSSCHGNDYSSPSVDTGYNVHRPKASGGYEVGVHTATPGSGDILIWAAGEHDSAMVGDGVVAGVSCTLCHNPEFVPVHDYQCGTCHPTPVSTLTPSWGGGCQQGGCHVAYHTDTRAHWPVEDDCLQCHDPGWTVPVTSCQNCHAVFSVGDTTPPVTTSDAQATYVGAARISFSITDGGKVGVGTTYFQVDDGPQSSGDSVLITTPGSHTLQFWSVDQSGNMETAVKTASFTIAADTTAPVTTSDARDAYYPTTINMSSATAVITLTSTDNGSLGVKTSYYRLDGGPVQTGTRITVAPPATGTASHTLEFWSEDYSGNVESANTAGFTITVGTGTIRLVWGDADVTGPPGAGSEASWVIRRGSWSGPVVASGSGAYPGWSGVDDYVFPLNPTFSYYVRVDWWDDSGGFFDQTDFSGVVITTDGQVQRLSY